LATICIESPVCGLRPSRAARCATENFPKPVSSTSLPSVQPWLARRPLAGRIGYPIRLVGVGSAADPTIYRRLNDRQRAAPTSRTILDCLVATTFLCLALLLSLPPSIADAARGRDGGQAAPATKRKPTPPKPPTAEPDQLTSPSQLSSSNLAKELDSKGQVDPIAGLGIRNPVCDQLAQIRDRSTRLSCEANGSPESDYPTSNYGFDVFIATGVTHPVGSFTAAFVTILNGIWLGLIFVLKLVLELLGLAFGLNPFSDGPTMSRVTAGIGRFYRQVTDPWLSTLIVCGGIWFAYRGLLRRDAAGGVGGTLAAIAMLVVGLWIVHQPRESVGRLAELSNDVALSVISAPHSGSLRRPVGTYAEAMSGTWDRLVEVPFAGLNFSDVSWALGRPPPEAVKRADAFFCQDVGALALIATYQRLGSSQANEECAAFARKRYGKPDRVIDLYLRSSPGSPARGALWDYFDKSEGERYKTKVATQGGDGALTRLSMLALFAIGLLGAILLLAWLAIRLFSQAAIAFVLLLAAPLALFFPMLGDAGRHAFKTWGLTLLGSLLAKVIYAAFLSIVLLGISILGRVEGVGGSATGFLLSSAFTWSVFLKRAELVGWLSVGDGERHGALRLGLAGTTAYGLGRTLTRGTAGSLRGTARRGVAWSRERSAAGSVATRQTARGSLLDSARALADQRHHDALQTVAAHEAPGAPSLPLADRKQRSAPPRPAPKTPDLEGLGVGPSELSAPGPQSPGRESYREAKWLLAGADRNQRRSGSRWTERDLQRFAAEDRTLLETSRDPADHAHRAGIERSRFESLRGPERARAEAQIEKARKRDLQRLALDSEPPGRIVGRGRIALERVRQGAEGAAPMRREALRALRRERRAGEYLRPRRNLSRGA
jgi:hypothetical protein